MNNLSKNILTFLHFLYLRPSFLFFSAFIFSFVFEFWVLTNKSKQFQQMTISFSPDFLHDLNIIIDTPLYSYLLFGAVLGHVLFSTLILYLFLSFVVDVLLMMFFKKAIVCDNCKGHP